jgi:hypothetical protein
MSGRGGRITVSLTRAQALRLQESLHAHFAGDTGVGDLSWTAREHRSAVQAQQALSAALGRPASRELWLKRKQARLRELLTYEPVYSDAPEAAAAVAEIRKLIEVIGQ